MTSGANLRQLIDFTLLLQHNFGMMIVPDLERYLKALHLMDVWHLLVYIAVDRLGLHLYEAPCYSARCRRRADRLLSDLLDGKLHQPKNDASAPKNRILRKLHTMHERLKEARRMRRYSPSYARHMVMTTILHGASRLFAADRRWE